MLVDTSLALLPINERLGFVPDYRYKLTGSNREASAFLFG